MYFVTDVDTFVVTYVTSYLTAVTVVTYVDYVLCATMSSSFMSTLAVRTVMGSKIGVHAIFGSNTPSHAAGT